MAPKLFLFTGIPRSGNHAVINWVCKNLLGKTLFYNACEICGEKELLVHDWTMYGTNDSTKYYPGKQSEEKLKSEFEGIANLVVSFEDLDICFFENDIVLRINPIKKFLDKHPTCEKN